MTDQQSENRRKGAAAARPESSSGDNQHARVVAREQAQWAKRLSAVVGAVFLIVGVAGFIPGITTSYDQLSWAGHSSGAMLLGVFAVSVLHNLVHLAFGVAGLVLARSLRGATTFLVGGGVVYLVLWFYGIAIHEHSSANFVPVNDADNWLHLGLGLGMVLLGLIGRRAMIAPGGPVED
jgi:uncharacterized protein DUF4383